MSKKKSSTKKKLDELENSTVNNLLYTDSHFHYFNIIGKCNEIENNEENSSPWINNQSVKELIESPNFQGMDIGTQFNDLEKRYNALHKYKNIYLSSGIGPWATELELDLDNQINEFTKTMIKYPVSAIGEIGLDNYWKYGTEAKQTELFIKQLDIANEMQLPIIIHTRDADNQMIDILKDRDFLYGGIIHCFSGSQQLADAALEKNLMLSFAGPITYKNNKELCDVLYNTPLSSLLLETDSPYLPPTPFRGKYNSPFLIPLVYEKASIIKKVSIQEISKIVSDNFLNLVGNPKRFVLK